MPPTVLALLSSQSGVIGRHQLAALGVSDNVLQGWVRTRRLTRLLRGVYVDHTGRPTFEQRCWAAVLAHRPAAVAGEAALRLAEGAASRRGEPVVALITAWESRRASQPGIVVVRRRGFRQLLHPGSGLPRMRYDEAVVDLVQDAPDELTCVSRLADAVNSRLTSARRLRSAVEGRHRVASRALVLGVLGDMEAGTCSVLEHHYVHRVERPHGLPTARRQARQTVRGRATYRDALTEDGVCIELDGLLHERFAQREHDFDRDLVAAGSGIATVRLSYGQVLDRPCWTAAQLVEVHRARGWRGHPRRCDPACVVV